MQTGFTDVLGVCCLVCQGSLVHCSEPMTGYRSFLFPGSEASERGCVLEARESHHLVRVFRARVGESVQVLDGKGTIYRGQLADANARAARIEVESVERYERTRQSVTLLQAMPKGKTMDLILRMATEIGVPRVQPIFTEHGELQLKGDRLESKLEKWRLTMIESCKQCGLPFLPELLQPVSLKDWLANSVPGDVLRLVASLEPGSRPLKNILAESQDTHEVVAAVGPEGDFSAAEYSGLQAAGFKPIRLGAYVLRAETAAAYILSVVDHYLDR